MKKTAEFSEDRRYRWALTREWDSRPWCVFIGLNPSTADDQADDPTIRRCITFAQSWDHGAFLMLNLYAYRATDPRELWVAQRQGVGIVGNQNYYEDLIRRIVESKATRVIAAWGAGGSERGKGFGTTAWLAGVKLDCLMRTKKGDPQHPLYLPSGLLPEPWNYAWSVDITR